MSMRLSVPIFFLVGSMAWSQSTPDLSGRWILNPERSSVPPDVPRPGRIELAINQGLDGMQCEWQFPSTAGAEHLIIRFKTNGTQSLAPSGGNEGRFEYLAESGKTSSAGPDIQVSAFWAGRRLAVRFKWYNPDKRVTEVDDTWSLSGDGKTLTIDRGFEPSLTPAFVNEHDARFVFERVDRAKKK